MNHLDLTIFTLTGFVNNFNYDKKRALIFDFQGSFSVIILICKTGFQAVNLS